MKRSSIGDDDLTLTNSRGKTLHPKFAGVHHVENGSSYDAVYTLDLPPRRPNALGVADETFTVDGPNVLTKAGHPFLFRYLTPGARLLF